MSEAAPSAERPRIPGVGEILSLLGESAGHRARLAQLELGEARNQVAALALLGAAAGILGLLAGLALTLLFAALVWQSGHRTWWLAGLCTAYLLGTAALGYALWRNLRQWRPFAETKFQLDQDGETLGRILRSYRRP